MPRAPLYFPVDVPPLMPGRQPRLGSAGAGTTHLERDEELAEYLAAKTRPVRASGAGPDEQRVLAWLADTMAREHGLDAGGTLDEAVRGLQEDLVIMRRAADAGYPQAQFVFGTFVARQRPGAPTDVCIAEEYWRRSAAGGRQAARVQYLRYTVKSRFDACPGRLSEPELRTMLDTAARSATDYFYERILIEDLAEALAARTRSAAP